MLQALFIVYLCYLLFKLYTGRISDHSLSCPEPEGPQRGRSVDGGPPSDPPTVEEPTEEASMEDEGGTESVAAPTGPEEKAPSQESAGAEDPAKMDMRPAPSCASLSGRAPGFTTEVSFGTAASTLLEFLADASRDVPVSPPPEASPQDSPAPATPSAEEGGSPPLSVLTPATPEDGGRG